MSPLRASARSCGTADRFHWLCNLTQALQLFAKDHVWMLEDAIAKLTIEVERLRRAIERHETLIESQLGTKTSRPMKATADREAPFLNEHQAARFAGLSVATLRRWRLFRKGPPFLKLGASVRYPRAELLEWIHEQKG